MRKLLLSDCYEICLQALPAKRRPDWSTGGKHKRSIRRLIKHFGDVPIASIEPKQIQEFVEKLQSDGRKESTVLSYYNDTRAIFRIVHEAGFIRKNPCKLSYTIEVEYAAKKRVSPEQMEAMIQATLSVRDEAILRIQKDSAARSNEIRLMKISTTRIRHFYMSDRGQRVWVNWNDVIPAGKEAKMIGVSQITHSKRRSGYIKFGHEACVALIRYKNSRKKIDNDWLWLSKRSELLGRTAFYMIYKAAGSRIGLRDCSPHKWRHGVAVHMRKQGAEFADIADLLNHKDVALTIREYGQLTEEEKVDRYLDVTAPMLQAGEEFPEEFGGWFE